MKLPWAKWFFADWLNDPQLSKCSPATRGVWVDLLGAMHNGDRSGQLCGTAEELSRLARCSAVEIVQSLTQLDTTGAATVTVRNGYYTVTNRRLAREYRERELNTLRQKRFRRNANSNGTVTPEKSEVIYQRSENNTGPPEDTADKVPWEWCVPWLKNVRANGADYTEKEAKTAWLALRANGWMWGRNPVVDWRAALERVIQTDRKHANNSRIGKPSGSSDNGTCETSTDIMSAIAKHKPRLA